MTVAVLGCGPAGMMTAHALARAAVPFEILTDRVAKSKLGGAQYLHEAIPGLDCLPAQPLEVRMHGTAQGYADKMRRDLDATSWHRFHEGAYEIRSLVAAYDLLWTSYSDAIKPILPVTSGAVLPLLGNYEYVFSTIPKTALCRKPDEHNFMQQEVWIKQGSYEEMCGIPQPEYQNDRMIYSGESSVPWYRHSLIYGVVSYEYPTERAGARKVVKPLSNDCDCWDHGTVPEADRVFFLGRYGKWDRRYLTHDAYQLAERLADVLL